MSKPCITLTMIFQGHALNRDEKIAGNITSIKKISFANKVYSFISRPAMRHYLFNTLVQAKQWKQAQVTTKGGVVQYDVINDDIINSEELDIFGYMQTLDTFSLTRKAPLHITKAISLIPYSNDMSFYANHNLVNRAINCGQYATPNPYQREENITFYKVSFTIDTKFVGEDTFIVDDVNYDANSKTLTIIFNDVKKDNKEDKDKNKNKDSENEDNINAESNESVENNQDGNDVKENSDSSTETDQKTGKNKKKRQSQQAQQTEPKKVCKVFRNVVERTNGEYDIYDDKQNIIATVSVVNLNDKKYKIKISLDNKIKERRIKDILNVIKNGIYSTASGESNTITPLFLIGAYVKVPCPIFDGHIFLTAQQSNLFSYDFYVCGIEDCLNNDYIISQVYIQDSAKLKVDNNILNHSKVTKDWDKFIQQF